MREIVYDYAREKWQNPNIGFTSFQHFGTDVLYSDLVVKPENNMTETEHVECYPIPDYVKEEGINEGFHPSSTISYIRILWKEFEPREGEYNYSLMDEILDKAREKGQTVMFRIMPHSTRESDDVPDWVKEIVDCPPRPVGMRVKTSPSDPKFLTLYARAIRVIGERYDSDPTFAYVDVSLPGAWGEGSSCGLFTEEEIKTFIDEAYSSYPNTHLLCQSAEPVYLEYLNAKRPVGWRADCIGEPSSMERVKKRHELIKDQWLRGPVSFESYWWLCEWKRKGWDLSVIIEKVLEMHASSFNAKSLPIPHEWKEQIEKWNDRMGYHNTPRILEVHGEVNGAALRGSKLKLDLEIENVGSAPIYDKTDVFYRLVRSDEKTKISFLTNADPRKWLPGRYSFTTDIDIPTDIPAGKYRLEIGMFMGASPVALPFVAEEKDGYFTLAEINVV